MKQEINEITLDGVDYIRKDLSSELKCSSDSVLVRGDRSGVFVGKLLEQNGREVTLGNCRRIWYWKGAASISQLAVDGTSKPSECKFPVAIKKMKVLDAIEIIEMTDKAVESINSVELWSE
jgi:hypothetical protein